MKITVQWASGEDDVTTVSVEEPVDGALVLDAMKTTAVATLLELVGEREPDRPTDP